MKKEIPLINQIMKDERKKKNITQEELSKLIFKSLGTIKRYDTGDIIPESSIVNMCKILNIDYINLLSLQDTSNSLCNNTFYQNLIKKHQNKIEQLKCIPQQLEQTAIKLLNLYKDFFDSSILSDDNIVHVKYPSYKYEYTITNNIINIIRTGVSLSDVESEKIIIATFTLESAKTFLKDIRYYFNLCNLKNKKEGI